MDDTRLVRVECPYCEHRNRVDVHRSEEDHPKIVECSGMMAASPGCGRYFAAQVTFSPSVKVYAIAEVPND